MPAQSIKTNKDYQNALTRLEKIFDAIPGSAEGDELEELGIMIDTYEKAHHSINAFESGENSGLEKI